MRRANVFTDEFEYDAEDPEGFRAAVAAVGKTAGGEETAIKAFEIPPGESVCPYHYEYVEEWLLVLDGDVLLRTPEGEHTLGRGDLVCFVPGPSGAHKVSNRGEQSARVVMLSSAHEPAVAVYPDSGKVGVWTPGAKDNLMFRREHGDVEYYDGER